MISHPAAFIFLAALIAPFFKGKLKAIALVGGPALALLALSGMGAPPDVQFMGFDLDIWRADALGLVFALVFVLAALLGHVYALHSEKPLEHAASLAMSGAGVAVVLAGDWLTLFIFWEVMSVASLFVIWFGGGKNSGPAGIRYLLMHALGGGMLLAGILLHLGSGGAAEVGPLLAAGERATPAFWLILAAVLMNAAAPPLNAWMTDAYPECSITGSVLQSSFTTKSAVYLLLRAFPGAELLVIVGTVMTIYGVIYAIIEDDIRRLLSYHILSQVGYMVAAAGLGTALAINGGAAHAFCHVLYKALLFMGAGAAIQATGKTKLSELGGIGAAMPSATFFYMIGAFSISGAPLLNGFISKSMIVSAAALIHRPVIETLLVLASVGTFLSVALKLAYFTFFGPKRPGLKVGKLPLNMLVAMAIMSLLCFLTGVIPSWLYARLPFEVEYHPYTFHHVLGAVFIMVGTGLGFWFLLKKFKMHAAVNLDTDWFYRKPFPVVVGGLSRFLGAGDRWWQGLSRGLVTEIVSVAAGSDGTGIPSPVGRTLFWMAAFFALGSFYAWG